MSIALRTMEIPVKAKIFVKQDQQGPRRKQIALSPVHMTCGSVQDMKYRVECPVWSKFEESPSDAVQSVAFDGENLIYTTEGKKINTSDHHIPSGELDFILKVDIESSDWCPIRIRVGCGDNEELEGEVIFVKRINSSDGNLKMAYNVVLFLDPDSGNIAGRVRHQQVEYLATTLASFDMDLLLERRKKLEELCREMQIQITSYSDHCDNSDDSSEK